MPRFQFLLKVVGSILNPAGTFVIRSFTVALSSISFTTLRSVGVFAVLLTCRAALFEEVTSTVAV